jgi:hypothetical protein
MHAFAQSLTIPHGYTKTQSRNHQELMKIAKMTVETMEAVHGANYSFGTSSELIYITSGSSLDWAYSKLGVKYVFAIEMRPLLTSTQIDGFMLPVDQIQPAVEETWVGIQKMASEIALITFNFNYIQSTAATASAVAQILLFLSTMILGF